MKEETKDIKTKIDGVVTVEDLLARGIIKSSKSVDALDESKIVRVRDIKKARLEEVNAERDAKKTSNKKTKPVKVAKNNEETDGGK